MNLQDQDLKCHASFSRCFLLGTRRSLRFGKYRDGLLAYFSTALPQSECLSPPKIHMLESTPKAMVLGGGALGGA